MMFTVDDVLSGIDQSLRTVFAKHQAGRAYPAESMLASEKQTSAALMRVNHVGEVCAQALYSAQALSTANPELKTQFEQAAQEETDHLAWTEQRLAELGGRTSVLNPLWYAGAFGIGFIAGRLGDRWSLGFVVETEKQVEHHLDSHLDRLPANDAPSRAIVEKMREDEIRHGQHAQDAGAQALPWAVRTAMKAAAKVMTTTAYRW